MKTAYQTFIKLWKYCDVPVKSSNNEAWSTNDITIYCKTVKLFYNLNFVIIFYFKSFPSLLFTTPHFWHFSTLWVVCIPALMAHFGEVLSLPFTEEREGGWQEDNKSYIIYKINPEITKIDTISARLTIFTWFWSLQK